MKYTQVACNVKYIPICEVEEASKANFDLESETLLAIKEEYDQFFREKGIWDRDYVPEVLKYCTLEPRALVIRTSIRYNNEIN